MAKKKKKADSSDSENIKDEPTTPEDESDVPSEDSPDSENPEPTPEDLTDPEDETPEPKAKKKGNRKVKELLEWIDEEQIRMRTPLPQPNSFEAGQARMLSVLKGKVQELE